MSTPFPQRSLEPLRSQGAAPIKLPNLNSVNIIPTAGGITTKPHNHETLYGCMHMLLSFNIIVLKTCCPPLAGYRKCLPQKHGKQTWLQLLSRKAVSTLQRQWLHYHGKRYLERTLPLEWRLSKTLTYTTGYEYPLGLGYESVFLRHGPQARGTWW